MGTRSDQIMGLPEGAHQFLEDNCKCVHTTIVKEYPKERNGDIHMVKSWRKEPWKEIYDEYSGMFNDQYPLYRYFLSNGEVLLEKVQTSPWSSGPMFFIMLVSEQTGETIWEWTEEQIRDQL